MPAVMMWLCRIFRDMTHGRRTGFDYKLLILQMLVNKLPIWLEQSFPPSLLILLG